MRGEQEEQRNRSRPLSYDCSCSSSSLSCPMIVHRLACRLSLANECLTQNLLSGLWVSACGRRFSTKGPITGDGIPAGRKRTESGYTAILRKSDREISLFGPKDPRTPFPGNVGMESAMYPEEEEALPELNTDFLNPLYEDPDVITSELNVERQSRIADQFVFPPYAGDLSDSESKLTRTNEIFECVSYPCPDLLAADVRELFPGRNFGSRVSVITISLRDTPSQSEEGLMREEVMDNFVFLAQLIVNKLHEQGYNADFIDPLIGRPMSGGVCRSSFLELDTRYRKLGFHLTKVGSCRILRHHVWGSQHYVGSVFTNAAHNSPEVRELTCRVTAL